MWDAPTLILCVFNKIKPTLVNIWVRAPTPSTGSGTSSDIVGWNQSFPKVKCKLGILADFIGSKTSQIHYFITPFGRITLLEYSCHSFGSARFLIEYFQPFHRDLLPPHRNLSPPYKNPPHKNLIHQLVDRHLQMYM